MNFVINFHIIALIGVLNRCSKPSKLGKMQFTVSLWLLWMSLSWDGCPSSIIKTSGCALGLNFLYNKAINIRHSFITASIGVCLHIHSIFSPCPCRSLPLAASLACQASCFSVYKLQGDSKKICPVHFLSHPGYVLSLITLIFSEMLAVGQT